MSLSAVEKPCRRHKAGKGRKDSIVRMHVPRGYVGVADEQQLRFESMRQLAGEAGDTIASLQQLADNGLRTVDHDSADQAEQLQRVQQVAGSAVQALTQLSEIARHARSYQAQRHQSQRTDTPH